MQVEEKLMRRCLQLAEYGKGHVAPNPMVGAVVVYNGKIIGEGYHREYGHPHAEVNAIASVKDQSLLEKSTLYVNLEPCSHYGKTPPCAALIIEKKIPRVVVGHLDPFPEVAGRGIQMLRNAGVEVKTDFLKEECEALNKRFLTFHRLKRPYIILKWAQSADGFLDREREPNDGRKAEVFSNDLTRMAVHKLRAEEAAIMVGSRTAVLDNPSLTVRYWAGPNPLRVTLDRDMSFPENLCLLDHQVPTVIFTENEVEDSDGLTYVKVTFVKNVLSQITDYLYRHNIQSLIVEGGSVLHKSFITEALWDEAHVEIAPNTLGTGVPAPQIDGTLILVEKCKKSTIIVYKNDVIP